MTINRTGNQLAIDRDTTDGVIYLGYASCGVTANSPKWGIQKLTMDDNNKLYSVEWALGTTDRIHKWSDRDTLEYS